jgi:hypothetical protein
MEMDRAHFKETSWCHRKRSALDWNPQGARRRGQPRKTWRRTTEEEITVMGKTWREDKALANQRRRWRSFTGALCSTLN